MNNPIFIIGAGRSGTNMLRDVLTTNPEYITWPCDEINLTFRHGNIRKEDDLFTEKETNNAAVNYIHGVFKRLQNKNKEATIIEKTCANSLRIPFLNSLFPNARYILIQRNGYDVTASAMIRWKASIELKYILEKLPYVPLTDIPYFFYHFVINRLSQIFSADKKQKVWGPIYKEMISDSKKLSLDEVCAKQWVNCLEIANKDLDKLSKNQVFKVKYANLLKDPKFEIEAILKWLNPNIVYDGEHIDQLVTSIRPGKKLKPKSKFRTDELKRIESIIDPMNLKYGL